MQSSGDGRVWNALNLRDLKGSELTDSTAEGFRCALGARRFNTIIGRGSVGLQVVPVARVGCVPCESVSRGWSRARSPAACRQIAPSIMERPFANHAWSAASEVVLSRCIGTVATGVGHHDRLYGVPKLRCWLGPTVRRGVRGKIRPFRRGRGSGGSLRCTARRAQGAARGWS